MKQKSQIFALISTLFILSSCDPATKRYLGIDRQSPDEYAVVKAAPLSVPPNFNLTPPNEATKRKNEQIKSSNDTALTEGDKLFLKKTQKKKAHKTIDQNKK